MTQGKIYTLIIQYSRAQESYRVTVPTDFHFQLQRRLLAFVVLTGFEGFGGCAVWLLKAFSI